MNEQEETDLLGPLSGKLTIIRLVVKNAEKLFSSGEVEKYCVLKDNSGKSSDTETSADAVKEFESTVFEDSFVLWISKLRKKKEVNKGYSISLDAINITEPPDTKFFDGNLQVGGGKGILAWTKEEFGGIEPEKYELYFTLTEPGGASRQFRIDPRLRGNPKGSLRMLIHFIRNLEGPVELRQSLNKIIDESNLDLGN
jgi:hypothetical protein